MNLKEFQSDSGRRHPTLFREFRVNFRVLPLRFARFVQAVVKKCYNANNGDSRRSKSQRKNPIAPI